MGIRTHLPQKKQHKTRPRPPTPTIADHMQSHTTQTQRARSPMMMDFDEQHEKGIPSRGQRETLLRRESKLGLMSIFGRHKSSNEGIRASSPVPDASACKSFSARSSIVDMSHRWSYGYQAQPLHVKHQRSASTIKAHSLQTKTSRASLAIWEPPPLFKAYPQAIRHAKLPSYTVSADAVLRLQHSLKGSISLAAGGLNISSLNLEQPEQLAPDHGMRARIKHRRIAASLESFKPEWTTKIYILVPSGYLLQYANQGPFDRLPEKILQLGKESAAFASDLIPGRHWVLQVSSHADADGTTATQRPSLLSRLPFRSEKRIASNYLMVLESADDMDGWIATIRREIESLGGKKKLSETGLPKTNEHARQCQVQASQRIFVMRESVQNSHPTSDHRWENPRKAPSTRSPNLSIDTSYADYDRPRSFDDGSTTSGISQDERHLNSLRYSDHRLSSNSSGQRTVITSPTSSPSCSPMRENFGGLTGDEIPGREVYSTSGFQGHSPMRSDAAAIYGRRHLMQGSHHQHEAHGGSTSSLRTWSRHSGSWDQEMQLSTAPASSTLGMPNFSVPHGRLPGALHDNAAESWSTSPPPLRTAMPSLSRGIRRPPPSAMSINPRPLSFVQDQPSPAIEKVVLEDQLPLPFSAASLGSLPGAYRVRQQHLKEDEKPDGLELSFPNSSLLSMQMPARDAVRACARRTGMRNSLSQAIEHDGLRPSFVTKHASCSLVHARSDTFARAPQPETLVDGHDGFKPTSRRAAQYNRRISLYARPGQRPVSLYPAPVFDPEEFTIPPALALPASAGARPKTSISNQHLRPVPTSLGTMHRRSISHLAQSEGPPPAPPPTCSLPPVPMSLDRLI